MDKVLVRLIKGKKREKFQMIVIIDERGNITTGHTEIKN